MPSNYRVVGKYIYRATTQDVDMGGTKPDGSPNIVRQPGTMSRVEVGTVLTDVQPEELAAAPDRFVLVTDEQLAQEAQALAELGVTARTFVPEMGCHEPVNAPDAVVQKPPLTPEEAVAVKEAEAAIGKVQAEQAQQRAEMEKAQAEARDKAMTETMQHSVEQQRQARGGRQQAPLPVTTSSPAPTSPAQPAPAPVTPEAAREGHPPPTPARGQRGSG